MPTKIVFLDDDPVIRIARLALEGRLDDPWLRAFFAPEQVDLTRLAQAARGLTRVDGAEVLLAADATQPITGASAVVFRRAIVDARLLDANPGIRLVQRFGERPDGIDLKAAAARNVAVSCLPRRTLNYTAEHALLLMLALSKRLLASDRAVRDGEYDAAGIRPIDDVAYNWAGLSGVEGLYAKTLGIVGLGEVGTIVARLARAFGMRVLYTKRRRITQADEQSLGVEYAALPALLGDADFVSLHASSTPENEKLADAPFFSAMKSGAIFINTTRGRLVDEDALFDALTRGRLWGAGLDVHRVEPRDPRDRIAALPNVVLTPHLAGGARSGVLQELEIILHNCHAALRGEVPRYAILTDTAQRPT